MYHKKNVFCLLGPTGIGKSYIAIELYQLLPIEIINVDSCNIYKYMDIGTDKPSKKILEIIPHHLIDIIDPIEYYSVNNFILDIKCLIHNIFKKNKIPLLVGGTMMYYNVLFKGLVLLPKCNYQIRSYLYHLLNKYGKHYLYNLLKKVDYWSCIRLHINDIKRIIRTLEIYFSTGKSLTYFLKKDKFILNYHFKKIILLPHDKNILIKNIKNRFISMLISGFEDEVYMLYTRGDLTPNMLFMKCIGYKQIWSYFTNHMSYFEMLNNSIITTISLIKKQYTWLMKWNKAYIIHVNNYRKVVNMIFTYINLHL